MTKADRVRVAVFGGLRLVPPATGLGGQQERALLARLIIERGTPVATAGLIEALWPDSPPPTAGKIVQVHVGHLRRLLGSDAIATTPKGYRLERSAIDLDLDEFETLLDEGRQRRAAGDLSGAEACCAAADILARGEPYADVADRPFLAAEVARLEELRWGAHEERFEIALERGAGGELVGPLGAAVRARPMREKLRAQLMLALYRAGRQVEALEVYLDTRRVLDAELGVDPGPELEELQSRILRHDPGRMPRVDDQRAAAFEPRPREPLDPGRPMAVGEQPAADHAPGEPPSDPSRLRVLEPVRSGRTRWVAVILALLLAGIAMVPRVAGLGTGASRPSSQPSSIDTGSVDGGSTEPVRAWALQPSDAALADGRVQGLGYLFEGYLMVGTLGDHGPPAVW